MPEFPLRLLNRQEWGAKQQDSGEATAHPLGQVIVHKRGTGTDQCDNAKDCSPLLQNLQMQHMTELKYPDIAYNFLVASDGTIYEGRGWKIRGEVTEEKYRDFHGSSIVVAFIGDFTDTTVSPLMDLALAALVKFGVEVGYISKNHVIVISEEEDSRMKD